MTRKLLLLYSQIAFPCSIFSQSIDSTETDKHVFLTDNTADLYFIWRFSKQNKWYVNLNYFAVRNEQRVILGDMVKWGDSKYPAGIILV